MGRKKLTEKKRTTSISLRPDVDKYIQMAEGTSFSEKMNNLIVWCMTREMFLHKQEKEYEAKLNALIEECGKLNEEIADRKIFITELDSLAAVLNNKLERYTSSDFRRGYKKYV